MSHLDEAEQEKLFRMSARVGELLQRSGITPSQSVSILIITLGRLLAREGYSDISANGAWKVVQNLKAMFDLGHTNERSYGHRGVPRQKSIT